MKAFASALLVSGAAAAASAIDFEQTGTTVSTMSTVSTVSTGLTVSTVSTVSTVIARCYLHLRWYFSSSNFVNTIYIMIQPWYEYNQKWTHHSSFKNPANLVKAQLLLLKGYRSQQTASHWSWEGLINPFFLDCHHLHHLHFTSLLINDLIILGILICHLYFECQYSCNFCRWNNGPIKV